jgi:hypothetical protein
MGQNMLTFRPIHAALVAACLFSPAFAQTTQPENFDAWPLLTDTFESTSGQGIIIKGYDPVIKGDKCSTNFSATLPDGKVFYNIVEFDAVPMQGGTLCMNGKYRAVDGSASGTTPFRVFFRDGVRRRSP